MNQNYQLENNPEFHVWDVEDYESIQSKQRFQNSWFSKYINSNSSVLDIGCGPGYTVKILQDNGIKVLGVDLNEVLVNRAVENGLNVKKIDASEAIDMYGAEYNVFLMSDFVEHVPLDVVVNILSKISKIPGCLVFICTPNLNSIMGFKFWFHMPTHVNAMHPYVIRKMVSSMNFKIIDEWTEYGLLPGKGWKFKVRKKFLQLLLGTQAELFFEGANINFILKSA
jgi:2-polyprenyl-3-methyl-5-hydroxy-6-metoxy-1,4-benzoquinol methylase